MSAEKKALELNGITDFEIVYVVLKRITRYYLNILNLFIKLRFFFVLHFMYYFSLVCACCDVNIFADKCRRRLL
jgi:hypothetical protein